MPHARKSHVLLTGATGLLGRYLIRDLAEHDVPLAVLVRPSRRMSAENRIEAICKFWKSESGVELPRPKVLVGNILDDNLGLSAEDREWVAENVGSMLHNAASLSFVSTGRHAEPWRSNVDGTQTVLDFCEDAQIKQFFHVSTAYVAGRRRGVVKENELNVGQELGNCYEESKLLAEESVRGAHQAGKLTSLTTFRPGIILGDSKTGFTSTFHHVYAALQTSYLLNQQMGIHDYTGKANASSIGMPMQGDHRKHLVPVDWVSAVMAHVIAKPELHGDTYHLTPRCPMRMRLLRDMIEEVIGSYGIRIEVPTCSKEELTEVEAIFLEQQEVYTSYWTDDPLFDTTNTRNAAPHLPCPHLDRAMLMHLAEVAIDMRFKFNDPKIKTKVTVDETVTTSSS